VLEVDSIGRPLRIWHENDHYQNDDLCEEIAYAEDGKTSHRVLDAVHTRTLRQCQGGRPDGIVVSRVRYRYDDLPEGQVDRGWLTHGIVERYDPTTGQQLGEVSLGRTRYDAFGNVVEVTVDDLRVDPVTGTVTSVTSADRFEELDPFALAPRRHVAHASDVAVDLVTTSVLDPFSLAPLVVTGSDGTATTAAYDGFGRPRRSGVIPAGGGERVLGEADYLGFAAGEAGGRRIRARIYRDEVGPGDLEAATPSVTTTWLDELGRAVRSEQELGSDYDGQVLIGGETTFDRLGRPSFVADPYVAGDGAGTRSCWPTATRWWRCRPPVAPIATTAAAAWPRSRARSACRAGPSPTTASGGSPA
jgi:hypothetical protein